MRGTTPLPLAKLPTMTNEQFIEELDTEFTLDSLAELLRDNVELASSDPQVALHRYEALAFHLWKQQF